MTMEEIQEMEQWLREERKQLQKEIARTDSFYKKADSGKSLIDKLKGLFGNDKTKEKKPK